MATLRGGLLFLAKRTRSLICQRKGYHFTAPVLAGNWNKDWQPSEKIPHTPEERAAAAKKYGLRPEDYNCLIEREIGDYPDLPLVATRYRDPFEDYDMPAERRNFGEPIHADNEIIGQELLDVREGDITFERSLLYSVLIFSGFLVSFLLFQPYPFFLPQMPKQHPFNNLYLENGGDPAQLKEVKHYTFEPAD